MFKIAALSGFLMFLLSFGTALGTTFYVPDDYPTIQDAINASLSGDTIIVKAGTYYENIDFLGKSIVLESESGPDVTVIDGMQSGSTVTLKSGEDSFAVLDGFKITNGTGASHPVNWGGGGIYCSGASPTIKGNVIVDNTSSPPSGWSCGGGILIAASSAVLEKNLVWSNSAALGGGLFVNDDCPSLEVVDNIFAGNAGGAHGGAADVSAGTYTNNLFADNHSASGGAVRASGNKTNFYNCTFYDNSASERGGAIFSYYGNESYVQDCIFRNNSAPCGPQICINMDGGNPQARLYIYNSCVEGGQGGIHVAGNGYLGWGTGNISSDPLFIDGPDHPLAPMANFHNGCYLQQDPPNTGKPLSPCVDTGGGANTLAGTTRTDLVEDSGIRDMGYHYPLPVFMLTVDPMPLVGGSWATFTVVKGQPYTLTALAFSRTGTSPNAFFFQLWNVYLDLINPVLAGGLSVGIERTNSEGKAEWVLPIPNVPPGGIDIWFQVSQPGSGGQEGPATNVVETTID
jgi:hypothetical protein